MMPCMTKQSDFCIQQCLRFRLSIHLHIVFIDSAVWVSNGMGPTLKLIKLYRAYRLTGKTFLGAHGSVCRFCLALAVHADWKAGYIMRNTDFVT